MSHATSRHTQLTADLERAVTVMATVRRCFSPSFSPDGSTLAFVSDLGGLPQIWTVAVEGGWPTAVTTLDDQVGAVSWSPDGAWLAFSLAPGGGMNTQVYLVRPDGTGLRRLTDGGKENNQLGPWSYDGQTLAMSSNRRSPDVMDCYVVDMAGGELQLVVRNKGIGALTDLSRDGLRGVVYRMLNRGDDNLFVAHIGTGQEQLLTPHEGPASSAGGLFSPDGRAIYLTSNVGREVSAFARVVLDEEGQPGPLEVLCAREDADLERFVLDHEGSVAALLWNVAGCNELGFYDLVTGVLTHGPKLPAQVVGGLTFARDGSLLALATQGARAPADIWVLDRATDTLRQLTHSSHAGVDLQALVQPELVRFPAHDGLQLSGWLYRPRPGLISGPGPLVLSFHGGPEAQERPVFNSTYQALLARGIAVLAPNVRGSAGFGKTFVNLDNGPLRVDAVRDIKASVDYVVGEGIAHPRRIGIMGGSYGGYMTMAGLTTYSDTFAAGANLYGVVNFATFFAHTEPWMAAISKVEYGDPATQADMLRELSPMDRIDQVVAPTIVLHGANDTNVPVVEAEQVVRSLRQRGVPVECVLFPDEGHGFTKTANRIRSTVAIVGWFTQYLTAE